MYTNKKIGNDCENKVKNKLASYGYWVTKLQDNAQGQPFDIIAIKKGDVLCVEVKHVKSKKYISFDRLEDNQILSFLALEKVGCLNNCFVFVMFGDCDDVYYCKYEDLREHKKIMIENLELMD